MNILKMRPFALKNPAGEHRGSSFTNLAEGLTGDLPPSPASGATCAFLPSPCSPPPVTPQGHPSTPCCAAGSVGTVHDTPLQPNYSFFIFFNGKDICILRVDAAQEGLSACFC